MAHTALPLAPTFIESRRRVWVALSDLFRDTELQPFEATSIARVLVEAGLSPAAAEEILLKEVAPVFYLNLYTTAGNWTGWADLDVETRIAEHLTRKRGFGIMDAVQRRISRGVVRDLEAWARVKAAMATTLPPWTRTGADEIPYEPEAPDASSSPP